MTFSYFFGTECNFYNYVCNLILRDFTNNNTKNIDDILVHILNNYQSTSKPSTEIKEIKNDVTKSSYNVDEILKQQLTDYKIKKANNEGIQMWDVFTNKELMFIISMKPLTKVMLRNCFYKNVEFKIKEFGDDIIKIVKSVIQVN